MTIIAIALSGCKTSQLFYMNTVMQKNFIAFSLLNLIQFKHYFLLRLEECEYVLVKNLLSIKFW